MISHYVTRVTPFNQSKAETISNFNVEPVPCMMIFVQVHCRIYMFQTPDGRHFIQYVHDGINLHWASDFAKSLRDPFGCFASDFS